MNLSIVMYHYVRELRCSRFPNIHGLETDEFREQIAYIKKHYTVISGAELLAAADAHALGTLPRAAALLTFDDGYLDHFTQVFPILQREKLAGCFFPPGKCTLEGQVLDVNKIHFVLASVPDKRLLVDQIRRLIDEHGPRYGARRSEDYWRELAIPGRFDAKEVAFIKRALQRQLPEQLRRTILQRLFREHVTSDEASFARDLYMTEDQVVCMRESGMYIGSHGYGHDWLDSLSPAEQEQEIALSLRFLQRIGARHAGWIMCYPHGAYDDSLLSILRRAGCRLGLTTRVGIADLARDNPLTLPRLNTNDIPKQAAAAPNEWTAHTCAPPAGPAGLVA